MTPLCDSWVNLPQSPYKARGLRTGTLWPHPVQVCTPNILVCRVARCFTYMPRASHTAVRSLKKNYQLLNVTNGLSQAQCQCLLCPPDILLPMYMHMSASVHAIIGCGLVLKMVSRWKKNTKKTETNKKPKSSESPTKTFMQSSPLFWALK